MEAARKGQAGDAAVVNSVEKPSRPRAAKAAEPAVVAPPKRANWKWAATTLLLMVATAGATAFLMRQHYHSGDVVAAVNGVAITKDAFLGQLQEAGGASVMRKMVNDELVLQYAAKEHLLPSEAQIDARYKALLSTPGFDAKGRSPAGVKRDLRVQLAKEAILDKGLHVTDADIRKVYDHNIDPKNMTARYYQPQSVVPAVIILRTDDEVRKALTELAEGISFAQVARKYSYDSSSASGGVLPRSYRGRSRMSQVPAMEQAVFNMKIGEQIGPVKYFGVYWIIRCLDKQPAKTAAFEQVREECRAGALMERGIKVNGDATSDAFLQFQKAADTQAFWPQYAQAVRVR